MNIDFYEWKVRWNYNVVSKRFSGNNIYVSVETI